MDSPGFLAGAVGEGSHHRFPSAESLGGLSAADVHDAGCGGGGSEPGERNSGNGIPFSIAAGARWAVEKTRGGKVKKRLSHPAWKSRKLRGIPTFPQPRRLREIELKLDI